MREGSVNDLVLSYHRLFRQTHVTTPTGIGVWRLAAVAAAFPVFSAPSLWLHSRGMPPLYVYTATTAAFTALIVLIAVTWPRESHAHEPASRRWPAAAIAVAALAMLAAGARYWTGLVAVNPMDPYHADMLPVIDAALRRFLRGHDPYGLYHVPWEAPLGYGPVMWAPFLIPHAIGADLRLAGVVGELAIPVWCAIAAVVESRRGSLGAGIAWLVVLGVVLVNPDIAFFTPVAHTPVYWPLLPLFAVLLAAERLNAAAVVLGLLVVGRSTMAAGVPIFLLWAWINHRAIALRLALLCAAPIVLLMLPFAIWDPHALWYGMVAVYPKTLKVLVWPYRNQGVDLTVGVTGWLVPHGYGRFVEISQAAAVLLAWAVGWVALRRGARPIPWMVVAVLAFCMTTLWPLYYIYFDVLLLLVSAAVAESVPLTTGLQRAGTWCASVVAAFALMVAAFATWASAYPAIDFHQPDAKQWLYKGFIGSRQAGETLPWIWGTDGSVTIARRSRASADIVMTVQPVVPRDADHQVMTATLNGRFLTSVRLPRGWQELRVHVPDDAWLIGANELKLSCSSTTPPIQVGLSDDGRHLALALRQIVVVR